MAEAKNWDGQVISLVVIRSGSARRRFRGLILEMGCMLLLGLLRGRHPQFMRRGRRQVDHRQSAAWADGIELLQFVMAGQGT